jgi:hypothetical protein
MFRATTTGGGGAHEAAAEHGVLHLRGQPSGRQLFAMDEGCLTVLDCGAVPAASGTFANRLRINHQRPSRARFRRSRIHHLHRKLQRGSASVPSQHYRRWRAEAGD